MKKTIELYKHPYMWKVEVTFGSLKEMLDNAQNMIPSNEVELGGSFNKRMWEESGRRAPLINIGVKISPNPELHRFPKADDITDVKGIGICHWEGVYWEISCFDEEIRNGLYPVKADWDGKTYIQDCTYKGKDKNGIPIVDKTYYRLTDTYRY